MQVARDECGRELKISGTLQINAAGELRKVLLDFLDRGSTAAVDLSEVEECDTAALQLLCSARKTAVCAEKHFALAGVSATVRNSCAALGLPLTEIAASAKGGNESAV